MCRVRRRVRHHSGDVEADMRHAIPLAGATAVLALAAVAAAGPGLALGPPAPTTALVLHYPMETLSGGTVPDDSGSGLAGHVVAEAGTPRLAPSLRGYGQALQLTGTQHQYVDVPRSPVLDVDHYTLSAWVRYTGIENDR